MLKSLKWISNTNFRRHYRDVCISNTPSIGHTQATEDIIKHLLCIHTQCHNSKLTRHRGSQHCFSFRTERLAGLNSYRIHPELHVILANTPQKQLML